MSKLSTRKTRATLVVSHAAPLEKGSLQDKPQEKRLAPEGSSERGVCGEEMKI